ncbi:hypothetical protein pb186bvf_007893 [Paramecium bursaria]
MVIIRQIIQNLQKNKKNKKSVFFPLPKLIRIISVNDNMERL